MTHVVTNTFLADADVASQSKRKKIILHPSSLYYIHKNDFISLANIFTYSITMKSIAFVVAATVALSSSDVSAFSSFNGQQLKNGAQNARTMTMEYIPR